MLLVRVVRVRVRVLVLLVLVLVLVLLVLLTKQGRRPRWRGVCCGSHGLFRNPAQYNIHGHTIQSRASPGSVQHGVSRSAEGKEKENTGSAPRLKSLAFFRPACPAHFAQIPSGSGFFFPHFQHVWCWMRPDPGSVSSSFFLSITVPCETMPVRPV